MILMLNNRDSFVFNLVRYFEELGLPVTVLNSDDATIDEIELLSPHAIVVSPGPCTPQEAGISLSAVQYFAGRIPILGVCLGHQVIAEAFGWQVVRSSNPTHGSSIELSHRQTGLFENLPNPLTVGLYHSLIVDPVDSSAPLKIDARAPSGEIMALSHTMHSVYGVQFHPESVMTRAGHAILENFLRLSKTPVST